MGVLGHMTHGDLRDTTHGDCRRVKKNISPVSATKPPDKRFSRGLGTKSTGTAPAPDCPQDRQRTRDLQQHSAPFNTRRRVGQRQRGTKPTNRYLQTNVVTVVLASEAVKAPLPTEIPVPALRFSADDVTFGVHEARVFVPPAMVIGTFLQVNDIWFRPLFAFFVLDIKSREVIHVGVTRAPTEQWTRSLLHQSDPVS